MEYRRLGDSDLEISEVASPAMTCSSVCSGWARSRSVWSSRPLGSRSPGLLREPNVASAIVGASRPEQVRENARSSGVRLDAETLAEIDGVLH
jgi:Aldo/keto reductase family